MLECINQILEFIINSAIVGGIIVLVYFYVKLHSLDVQIEAIEKKFENKRALSRERCVPQPFIDGEISVLDKAKVENIAPLRRERERIISKIPFIK